MAAPWGGFVEPANDDVTVIQDDIMDLRESNDPNTLLYNDTLDIDRYDKNIESADEKWEDFPVVEEDK